MAHSLRPAIGSARWVGVVLASLLVFATVRAQPAGAPPDEGASADPRAGEGTEVDTGDPRASEGTEVDPDGNANDSGSASDSDGNPDRDADAGNQGPSNPGLEPTDSDLDLDSHSDPNADPGLDPTNSEDADADLDLDDTDPGDSDSEHASNGPRVRYFLERVVVRGNDRTRASTILDYVPLERGQVLDPEDETLQSIEWRLRGTGWFSHVELSIEPGARHGWVLLVVRVRERNTIVVSSLTLGVSEGLNRSEDDTTDLVPYIGGTLSENNLFGTGSQLALSVLGSTRAWGLRLDYLHPRLLSNGWALAAAPYFGKARQYFGHDPLLTGSCDPDVSGCEEELEARNAVVFYQFGGLVLGTARRLGSATRLSIDYVGEVYHLRARPDAASETRGRDVRPIDFALHDGVSYVSLLRAGLTFDRRDDPAMTSRGLYIRFNADFAHRVLGSDYDFLRLRLLFRAWQPFQHRQSVRFSASIGAIFGSAPFTYQFQASDLSDLIPGRVLGMQLDRRPPPNLLNNSIEVMRTEEFAARVDFQYEVGLYRSDKNLRGVNAYLNAGVYTLADPRDLRIGMEGYRRGSRFPIDLTLDLGVRFDTRVGVFQVGVSSIFGLVAL